MKLEDISRLKQICDENGFEIKSESQSGLLYYIDKKDPWDGVEFVKADGKIFKIKREDEHGFYYGYGNFVGRKYKGATPSTESEYFEQLKKEAFERFGDIKEGDVFDRSGIDASWPNEKIYDLDSGFEYRKSDDVLYFGGIAIYQSGKWATKLSEIIKVKITRTTLYATQMDNQQEIEIRFESSKPINKSKQSIGDFLSKQLENYLNENQE